ncbi:hypothetical protein [Micromonospora sp. NPDC023633]|uniref:hypothetical protein n=1 Tax=Micromonospora sp. NPDC023633 TaxID=3154320 RepID=UPI00340BF2EA
MATDWRPGMRLTKARLDDGSAVTWTTNRTIRAEQLRTAYGRDIRAGDDLTSTRMNP